MGFRGSYIASAGNNEALPAVGDVVDNSPIHMLQHSVGRHAQKTAHAIDGAGAQNDNIFQVTGIVQVHLLVLHIDTVTDATTFSGVKFELYDSTVATNITGATDCSGCVVGAMIFKKGLLAVGVEFVNTTVGVISEAAANKINFEPFFAFQKTGGAATYIRLAFTGDGATDIVGDIESHWTPISHNGNLVSV